DGTITLHANGSFTDTPTENFYGTDTFQYQVKDAAGAFSNVATVALIIQPGPITALTVTADRAAPQPAGTTIALTAAVTGGTAPVEFKWWVFGVTGWTVLQEWSAATSATRGRAAGKPGGQVGVW